MVLDIEVDKGVKETKHRIGMEIIGKIQDVRTKNNVNWMDLVRLAWTNNPEETGRIMAGVLSHDQEISSLVEELVEISK